MPTLSLRRPLPHQRAILADPARYKVLACGRRWGKSALAMHACIDGHGPLVDGRPQWRGALHGGHIWWVAPTYKMAEAQWRDLRGEVGGVARVLESELRVLLPGGGWIQVRSADNPDALRGVGLDGVVLDEAAMMPPEVWSMVLRPTLADRNGWAIFASTPRGAQNWYYDLYQAAAEQEGWSRWHGTTADNPVLPPGELDAMRREIGSDQAIRQELEADWLVMAEQRFSPHALENGRAMVRAPLAVVPLPPGLGAEHLRIWEMPRAGVPYVVYTDPAEAKGRDYTCTVVVDARNLRHVATMRDNVVEPTQHGQRAILLAQWYNMALYGCEANKGEAILYAVGAAGYPRVYWHPRPQTLEQRMKGGPTHQLGLPVTAQTRTGLVDDLAAEIDSGRLWSPDEVFWRECDTFVLDAKGRASAMEGRHDDMVLALAGAVRVARSPGAQSIMMAQGAMPPPVRAYSWS